MSMHDELISIAIPKGRLFPDVAALFSRAGVGQVETLMDSRRLTLEDPERGLRFLALKPVDIPTYVEHGAADMGVVGKDLLLEQGRDVYEPLDLHVGRCRLIVAEPRDLRAQDDPTAWSCLRVATKYPQAIFDDAEQRWISDAEVAEVPYTAFTSAGAKAVPGRLIVRRVNRLNPAACHGQHTLFPDWRHHAVFTT